ncbi:DUF3095 domain-containing protein [Rhizobium sp. SL42]|uniref:DUF3095 domain-containing protein n=1 Tax=Rhizobium sp. SL42 TaxID=2806346 RepID=UPI001F23BA84|nr:DUF3095 domain-containing protein [Rhizobium sp. SL42]UJW75060.1 DUF3095 domain-containing protein [Rhizobium sp. SL42]
MNVGPDDRFYQSVPLFARFEGVVDRQNYKPLPDDWCLAIADIVGSTNAILEGRYKAVNMAGASVISAVLNALGEHELPFIFGGDGAMVAIPAGGVQTAARALASLRNWVASDLHLDMRVALVPVSDIRARGLDVRVARFAASTHIAYAMFTGGGATWAEQEMKAGRYRVDVLDAEPRPDLTGLSCRWDPIQAHNGEIVSIIAKPRSAETMDAFRKLVGDIIAVTAEQNREAHPIPAAGPDLAFSAEGIRNEARATAPASKRLRQRLSITVQIILTVVLHKLNLPLGKFDARRYKADVAANSDFRKFDDGLMMTVDVDAGHRDRLVQRLEAAERDGVCEFGLHRQDKALLTCFVATALSRDHMHFIDGASGGYALAASQLSEKRAQAREAEAQVLAQPTEQNI